MTEPDFLELEEVLELHERQIEAFGGTLGIRDQGLLESALGPSKWPRSCSRALAVGKVFAAPAARGGGDYDAGTSATAATGEEQPSPA